MKVLSGAGTVLLLLTSMLTPAAWAQTPTPSPSQGFPTPPAALQTLDTHTLFELPEVAITKLAVESASPEGNIQGIFTVSNHAAAIVSDLRYQIQLLSAHPTVTPGTLQADSALEYDRALSTAGITLLPGRTKDITFSYTLPPVPAGDYRLRLRLITATGRFLGWHDAPLHIEKAGLPFFTVRPGPLLRADGKVAYPTEGLVVDPNATVRFRLAVEGSAGQQVRAVLQVFRWGITGEKVHEETLGPFFFRGQSKVLEIPVVAPTTPDAYSIRFTLQNAQGTHLANTTEHRFVVKGPSAKVVWAGFDALPLDSKEPATVTIAAVGPADRTATVEAKAGVELLDGDEVVAERTLSPVTLSQYVQMASIPFTLPKGLSSPGIRVTIRDDQGIVLDQVTTRTSLSAEERQEAAQRAAAKQYRDQFRSLKPWIPIALVVVPLIVGLMLPRLRKKKRSRPGEPLVPLIIVSTIIALGIAQAVRAHHGVRVEKAGLPWTAGGSVLMVINEPRDESTVTAPIPVRVDIQAAAAPVTPAAVRLSARHGRRGGRQTSAALRQAVEDGEQIWLQPSPACAERDCVAVQNFIASIPLKGPQPLGATTLQLEILAQAFQPSYAAALDTRNIFLRLAAGRANDAACVRLDAPDRVAPAQKFEAAVTVKNTGRETWSSDDTPHGLGAQNPPDNKTWGLGRVPLPRSVVPGEEVTFRISAIAPAIVGPTPFSWSMIEESVEWFGPTCEKTITVAK